MATELRGKRVTVMGLGRFGGGVGVTRWLAGQGGRGLVRALAPAGRRGAWGRAVRDCGAALRLGEHRESDFCEADLVVVNPAVPERSEHLRMARAAGVPLTTEINLFVERLRGHCVGVTGSVGKSTVTSML